MENDKVPNLEQITEGTHPVILLGPKESLKRLEDVLRVVSDIELWRFSGRQPAPDEVRELAEVLEERVEDSGLKRITLIGDSWGAPVAIEYCSSFPRNVRRLILVNGRARLHQTLFERVIERIEEFLPLGFPLRPLSRAFDPRPILHRVRCPTLIIYSDDTESDAQFLANRIPNAWLEKLSSRELQNSLTLFMEVSTKQPQKNIFRSGEKGDRAV